MKETKSISSKGLRRVLLDVVAVALALGSVTLKTTAQPIIRNLTAIEAGAGTITTPFVFAKDCISQPFQTGLTNGGRAAYTLMISNAGDYIIQAVVNAPNGSANSFYVNIDAEPQEPSM